MGKHYLAHLAHVELGTPRLEESAEFFKTIVGLHETTRTDDSIYLRCWGDFYHHSLKLTRTAQPELLHAAWRTYGPEELKEAAASVKASGTTGEWIKGDLGHGDAFRFRTPGGHMLELFWEVERYKAPEGMKSSYPDRPQKHFTTGLSPRQLDHVTVSTSDVVKQAEWLRDVLGFRFMATTSFEDNPNMVVFGVTTTNEKSHDLGLGKDFSSAPGRLHHLAFWVENQDDLLRCADVLIEAGTPIEFGPGKHGIGEQSYLYFREPGGLRIEVNTGGYRNYVPDWQPHNWLPSEGSNTMYRNLSMPDSMMESFPPSDGPAVADADLVPAGIGTVNPWARK